MTLPDAVRTAVESAVSEAPSGEALLAATLRRERPSRHWIVPVTAVAAAVVAVAAGATFVATPGHHGTPAVRAAQAVVVADGLRVTLKVDRSSARVGDLVHAQASVTNTRATAVRFGGDSCQAPENQPNVDVDLRPGQPRGRTWAGAAAVTKASALDRAPYAGTFGSREGNHVCLDYYRTWTLDPGQTLTVKDVVWRAQTPLNSAYDGEGTVRASFRYTLDGADKLPHEVAARLPLHVTGGDPKVLSPAAAFDTALADPRFAAFVEANPARTWSKDGPGPGVTTLPFYKAPANGRLTPGNVWLVYLRRNVNARYGSLTLDPRTGAILRRDLPPPSLQPADAQTPAAGACLTAAGRIATVELNPDVPAPRCLIVKPDQQLRVVNTTARYGSAGQIVTVQWAAYPERQLAIGASTTYDMPLGDYLAPGVHLLRSSLYRGSAAAVWLQR